MPIAKAIWLCWAAAPLIQREGKRDIRVSKYPVEKVAIRGRACGQAATFTVKGFLTESR